MGTMCILRKINLESGPAGDRSNVDINSNNDGEAP
jgi:hypothetical protein